ncbi:hypothetical protein [uncultured Marivirga sp.]|uniref:hypothetical protein n=1 Tax=uncultured Marivirga sp. TaxID=1123707 RepID=UPI0030ED38CC|tara:strand:- start:351104 stop:351271 length:168 start_codon:yes stop_codon:yes gene_type:complete
MSSNKKHLSKENREEKLSTSSKQVSSKKKGDSKEEERNGIIPEGMDFKKFMGCGG